MQGETRKRLVRAFLGRGPDGRYRPGLFPGIEDAYEIPEAYLCSCKLLMSTCVICNNGWRERGLPEPRKADD